MRTGDEGGWRLGLWRALADGRASPIQAPHARLFPRRGVHLQHDSAHTTHAAHTLPAATNVPLLLVQCITAAARQHSSSELGVPQNRWDLADGVVWKSTGVMESYDQGRSWSTGGAIITADEGRCGLWLLLQNIRRSVWYSFARSTCRLLLDLLQAAAALRAYGRDTGAQLVHGRHHHPCRQGLLTA